MPLIYRTAARRLALLGLLSLLPATLWGATPSTRATNSWAAREEAINSIPYKQLDRAGRNKVRQVLSQVSIYRRLPVQVTRCDPKLYLFLIEHPDVTVKLW